MKLFSQDVEVDAIKEVGKKKDQQNCKNYRKPINEEN